MDKVVTLLLTAAVSRMLKLLARFPLRFVGHNREFSDLMASSFLPSPQMLNITSVNKKRDSASAYFWATHAQSKLEALDTH